MLPPFHISSKLERFPETFAWSSWQVQQDCSVAAIDGDKSFERSDIID